MHNRSKDHCSPKYEVLLRQRQSPFPRYSRGCCTLHYCGNTVNSKPITTVQYYRELQSHSRGNTANTATLSLFSSNMPGLMWCPVQALQDHDTVSTAKPMLGRSLFLLQNRFLALVYCQISTDLDKILHTPIAIRNTLVGRLRPRSARGRLQAKRVFFFKYL